MRYAEGKRNAFSSPAPPQLDLWEKADDAEYPWLMDAIRNKLRQIRWDFSTLEAIAQDEAHKLVFMHFFPSHTEAPEVLSAQDCLDYLTYGNTVTHEICTIYTQVKSRFQEYRLALIRGHNSYVDATKDLPTELKGLSEEHLKTFLGLLRKAAKKRNIYFRNENYMKVCTSFLLFQVLMFLPGHPVLLCIPARQSPGYRSA